MAIEQLTALCQQQWLKYSELPHLSGVRRDFESLSETYQQLLNCQGGRIARKFS